MKIIIISMPRSASNYLYDTVIKNFPKHHYDKYIIDRHYEKNTVNEIVKKLKTKRDLILKLHSRHLFDLSNNLFTDYFLNDNWYKIILMRKNLFNATLSMSIGLTLNEFDDRTPWKTNISLNVNAKVFKNALDIQIQNLNSMAYLKKNYFIDKIVYYEDLNFVQPLDISHLGLPINLTDNKKLSKYHDRPVKNIDKLKNIFDKKVRKFNSPYIKRDNENFELI